MKQVVLTERVIECLSSYYGIKVNHLTRLPVGADLNSSVYKAQQVDGSSYFVKLKRGHDHETGVLVVGVLESAGIQQIIPPIKTLQGRFTQPVEEFTLIVYPFIDGQDGFSRDLTDDQWRALGKALRQVHDIQVPPAILKQIRKEDYSSLWREAVQGLSTQVNMAANGDDVTSMFTKFMQANRETILRLVNGAEQLCQKIKDQAPPFVLCHSDIHGGNVLLDQGGALYMVDWDNPIMAPRERDLMFIGGGVANVWNKPEEEELFFYGYGKVSLNAAVLSYYRHERIVEDIAEYGQEFLFPTAGSQDRQKMFKQFTDMFVPRGVVDIALKKGPAISF